MIADRSEVRSFSAHELQTVGLSSNDSPVMGWYSNGCWQILQAVVLMTVPARTDFG
jgi:hypothetical protein